MVRKTIPGRPNRRGTARSKYGDNDVGKDTCPVYEVPYSDSSTPLNAIQERVVITSEVPPLSSSTLHGRDHNTLIHAPSEVPRLDSPTSLDAIVDKIVATSRVPHSGSSIPLNAKHERGIDASFQVLHSSSCMSPDGNHERMEEIKERYVDVTTSDTNTSVTESGLQSEIHPDGDGFAPNPTGVAHYISRIIQTNFDGPWPTWKKVPIGVRDTWFELFKKRFCWLPEHEGQIRINFENKGRIRLKENFCEARKKPYVRPFWLSPQVWDSLLVYWGSDEFKAKSAQARKNRASGDGSGSHTGGSIPASEHKRRLEAKLGREITTGELFMHLHQKKDKSWVDEKSSKAYEKFSRKWKEIQASQNSSEHESEGPSTHASISELDVWINENGKRGRIYGLGSEGAKYKGTTPRVETTTSFVDSSEIQDLLSKMQKQLNKERHEKEELARRIGILERDKIEKDEAIRRMERQNDEIIALMMKQHRKAEKHINKKFEAMMYMFRTSRGGDGDDDTTSDSE